MLTRKLPLIIVLGTTATGKSKLAIEVARVSGGEIIGADSMQVYKGLDIATNKVTKDEMKQAHHHLIDFVEPTSRFSIVDFRNKAINIIDSLLDKNLIPVVVGGTHYYIESILWNNFTIGSPRSDSQKTQETNQTLLDLEIERYHSLDEDKKHSKEDFQDVDKFFSKSIMHNSFVDFSSTDLWKILESVDPAAASLHHPNNRRKIIRCLQVIQDKGRNYTDILEDMNKVSDNDDKNKLGGPLRYNPTCVLWLHTDEKSLKKVVHNRVVEMLQKGLLTELEEFYEKYKEIRAKQVNCSYEKGVFQTIGFKEFEPYLALTSEEKRSDAGNKLLSQAIEDMKRSTFQYSKRQLRWIERRLVLSRHKRQLPQVFKFETSLSDEVSWETKVMQPALKIVDSLKQGKNLDDELEKYRVVVDEELEFDEFKPGRYYCESCDMTIFGNHSITTHLKSRSHWKMVDRVKKLTTSREASSSET